jgi:hypothetical protein
VKKTNTCEVSVSHGERFIALIMEAERSSETSVDFSVITRRYIPEDSKLQTNTDYCVCITNRHVHIRR